MRWQGSPFQPQTGIKTGARAKAFPLDIHHPGLMAGDTFTETKE
jgi:hypothetical protein